MLIMLSNGVSTIIQLWKPINLRTPEDGDDMFSETSVQNSATCNKVPEELFNSYHHESIPEDSVLF
jgi:hypothetical protein